MARALVAAVTKAAVTRVAATRVAVMMTMMNPIHPIAARWNNWLMVNAYVLPTQTRILASANAILDLLKVETRAYRNKMNKPIKKNVRHLL